MGKSRKKFDMWLEDGERNNKKKDAKRDKRKSRILEKTLMLYTYDKELEDKKKK